MSSRHNKSRLAKRLQVFASGLILALPLLASGCGKNPVVLESKKLSQFEGSDTEGMPLEEALAHYKENPEQVVRLKVGAGKGETFDLKVSEFLVSAIPAGEHASDPLHDPSSCPFCRKRAENAPTVVVRVIDASGKSFPQSAETLFGLKKGMHLLVKGSTSFDEELDTYTITATGLKILN